MNTRDFTTVAVCFLMIAVIKLAWGGYLLATLSSVDQARQKAADFVATMDQSPSEDSPGASGLVQVMLDNRYGQARDARRDRGLDSLFTGFCIVALLALALGERQARLASVSGHDPGRDAAAR